MSESTPKPRKRGRPAGAKPPVDPAARLQAMAARRVPNAVRAIRLCGNIASYKPSPAQASAIITALKDAVKHVETRFTSSTGRDGITFVLPEK